MPAEPPLREDPFEGLRSPGGRRRVPLVRQLSASDCAAASLAMVLAYHGRHERLAEVRRTIGVDRDGADAGAVIRGAARFGLHGRAIRLGIDALDRLPAATMLHWGFDHFVVFERVTRRGVWVVDPVSGRLCLPAREVSRRFTGIAICFEPTDDFQRTPAQPDRLVTYARAMLGDRGLVARIVAVSLTLRLLTLAAPLALLLLVDQALMTGDRQLVWLVGAGLGVMLLTRMVARIVHGHLALQLRIAFDVRLAVSFVAHLIRLPYAFFQQRSAGDLMMRLGSGASVREMLAGNLLAVLIDGPLLVVYLVALLALAPVAAGIAALAGVASVLLYLVWQRRYRTLMNLDLEAQARTQTHLVQLVHGIEALKAGGAEHLAADTWANLHVAESNIALERARRDNLVGTIADAVHGAAPALALVWSALQVSAGALTAGTMLAATALVVLFVEPIAGVVRAGLDLQTVRSYLEVIDDIFDAEPEAAGSLRLPPAPLTGAVRIEGVSFRYGPQAPPVLHELSLDIAAGEHVAIVGPSGSGKSTLARLLVGLHLPDAGRIRYDQQDLASLDLPALRRLLGFVPQTPYLFATSVRANIALNSPAIALDRIQEAARAAAIHGEIEALPMGYHTQLPDAGASLSGGQRQRLVLARALLHRPAILVLDEATSSLDARTERTVTDGLAALDCTRITIAHRLSSVVDADRIVVLDGGRIVETGIHDQLVAAGGTYARLFAAQLRSEGGA